MDTLELFRWLQQTLEHLPQPGRPALQWPELERLEAEKRTHIDWCATSLLSAVEPSPIDPVDAYFLRQRLLWAQTLMSALIARRSPLRKKSWRDPQIYWLLVDSWAAAGLMVWQVQEQLRHEDGSRAPKIPPGVDHFST